MTITELIQLTDVRSACTSGAARALRLSAGLSLGEVAREIGVAVPTVFRWERNERRPRGEAGIRYGLLLAALAERQRPRRPRETPMD